MLTILEGVLNSEQLSYVRDVFNKGQYRDGNSYLGNVAKDIKNNQELQLNSAQLNQLNSVVMGNLCKHPQFAKAAFPHKIANPLYACYKPGMSYGTHIDEAIMGPNTDKYRSDLSITIFLSDTKDYDGGELIIELPFSKQSVKLAAGDAVLYPSKTLHQVAEVTRGERLVAVSWIQSMIPDAERRDLLYQFGNSLDKLIANTPKSEETLQLANVYTNLKRRWALL